MSRRSDSHNALSSNTLSLLLVGFWTVAIAIVVALDPPWLQALELHTQTGFFRLRGKVSPPKDVVILAIDDDSLTQGSQFVEVPELEPIRVWTWRRSAYARAIDKLMAAGANAVALDLVLDAPSEYPADDKQLQTVLQRHAGRVTLAATHLPATSDTASEQLLYPDPGFQAHARSIGLINYTFESNGQIRRFADAYLKHYISSDLLRAQRNLQPFAQSILHAADRSFADPGENYIFFYGEQNTFPTISFWQVLDPQAWSYLQQQQTFKDKIVLIGATATILQDSHPTPFHNKVPGVEIHANAIATLLEGRTLSPAVSDPMLRSVLLLLGIAAVGIGLGRSKHPVPQFLGSIGVAVLWLGISYASFTYGRLILPTAAPVIALGLVGLSHLGTGAFSDRMEKLRLRRTLERYVSAPVVEEILNQPEDFRTLLQGRKLNAAVLFCDIRGFTSLAYKLPAEQLVAQLNTYLNVMVEAIIQSDGTIDKFIGDAIMAEFGSPVSRGEKVDAINAVKAALNMRTSLAQLRLRSQAENKTLLFNGIGINYGEVVTGNIGSIHRLEYTVIGDTVNVASRVETLTKQFQTDILITESLYTLVQDEVEAVFVGEQPLRGREESPTRLYSLVSLKGEDAALYYQIQKELKQHFEATVETTE